ncbi:MAG: hypothetical protein ACOZCL_14925 [Bacillota bacterium]
MVAQDPTGDTAGKVNDIKIIFTVVYKDILFTAADIIGDNPNISYELDFNNDGLHENVIHFKHDRKDADIYKSTKTGVDELIGNIKVTVNETIGLMIPVENINNPDSIYIRTVTRMPVSESEYVLCDQTDGYYSIHFKWYKNVKCASCT